MMVKKRHAVGDIHIDAERLHITIDGREMSFTLRSLSKKLLHGSALQRETFEVSPSGYGIHWPLLDEDLSVDGFLGIGHAPASAGRSPVNAAARK